MKKKSKGRPRKVADSMQPWQFGRAGRGMAAYDEAREKGEKHSAAVRYAVDSLGELAETLNFGNRSETHSFQV